MLLTIATTTRSAKVLTATARSATVLTTTTRSATSTNRPAAELTITTRSTINKHFSNVYKGWGGGKVAKNKWNQIFKSIKNQNVNRINHLIDLLMIENNNSTKNYQGLRIKSINISGRGK